MYEVANACKCYFIWFLDLQGVLKNGVIRLNYMMHAACLYYTDIKFDVFAIIMIRIMLAFFI